VFALIIVKRPASDKTVFGLFAFILAIVSGVCFMPLRWLGFPSFARLCFFLTSSGVAKP